MLKVLMIDDEPLARIGMRALVPWEENGFTLVGEAQNGAEGLVLAQKYRPDLIVTDIVMPEMDGLTFISQVKKILPQTRLIIMSCMSEIPYLQKAIRLGVSEYILKEQIDPNDIMRVVRRVADEIRQSKVLQEGGAADLVNQNLVLTEFMNLVLRGQIHDGRIILEKLRSAGLAGEGEKLAAAFVGLDYAAQEGECLDYSAWNVCQEMANSSLPGLFFVADKNKLAAIFSLKPSMDRAYLERFFRQMSDTLLQCLDCTATMGISAPFLEAEECPQKLEEARQAQELGFLYGKGKLFPFTPRQEAGNTLFPLINRALKMEGVQAVGAVAKLLEELPGRMRQDGFTAPQCREACLDLYRHMKRTLQSSELQREESLFEKLQPFASPETFSDMDQYAASFSRYLRELEKEWSFGQEKKKDDLVQSIQRYVDAHLREKISLDSISHAVYRSPSYICRIFKQETGENLQDYVIQKKLNESILLLREYRVGEVSDLLSFSSHSYFIKRFKEKYGITPLQFQKRQ